MRLFGRYVWTLGKQRMHFFRVAHLKLSRVSARAATQNAQSITALQELSGRKHTRWSWSPRHAALGHLGTCVHDTRSTQPSQVSQSGHCLEALTMLCRSRSEPLARLQITPRHLTFGIGIATRDRQASATLTNRRKPTSTGNAAQVWSCGRTCDARTMSR